MGPTVDGMVDPQRSLDDYAKTIATVARDHGLKVSEAADPEWAERALELIWQLLPGDRITADDVRSDLGASNAMGSLFHRARAAGWIRCIGYTTSRSVPWRGGVVRVWERL
jgi:hypothetical protein